MTSWDEAVLNGIIEGVKWADECGDGSMENMAEVIMRMEDRAAGKDSLNVTCMTGNEGIILCKFAALGWAAVKAALDLRETARKASPKKDAENN